MTDGVIVRLRIPGEAGGEGGAECGRWFRAVHRTGWFIVSPLPVQLVSSGIPKWLTRREELVVPLRYCIPDQVGETLLEEKVAATSGSHPQK